MRIHHLDCCSMCPVGGRLLWGDAARMVGHVLAIETEHDGVVLVDTGVGLEDVAHRAKRLGPIAVLGRFPTSPEGTAVRQLEALGFAASDVRHLVVTHFDLDHAGGIGDFPDTTVHLLQAEQDAVLRPTGLVEGHRYRPAHVEAVRRWQTYEGTGEAWRGFPAAQRLEGLQADVLLLPLIGHSRGHACVAVEGEGGWMVHAGDAYFRRESLTGGTVPLAARMFERSAAWDLARVRANHARLTEVVAGGELDVFCAHDANELDAHLSAR